MKTLQISSEGLLIQGYGRKAAERLADQYLPLAVSWAAGELSVKKIGFNDGADDGNVTPDTGAVAKLLRR